MKVVTSAPALPNNGIQYPAAAASPLYKCHTMMKKEKPEMVINALYIRKVEIQSFLKGREENASTNPLKIFLRFPPSALAVKGE